MNIRFPGKKNLKLGSEKKILEMLVE